MPDQTLNNTLTGTLPSQQQQVAPVPEQPSMVLPQTTTNNAQNISQLQSIVKTPNQLQDFQKVMAMTNSQAYKERQASELAITKNNTDFTKISGGLFSSIIGNLEQRRGGQIKGIGQAVETSYMDMEKEAQNRLNFLQEWEQKKSAAERDYSLAKKVAKNQKGSKAKKNAKKAAENDWKNFNDQYNLAIQQAGTNNSYLNYSLIDIKQSIDDLQAQNYDYNQINYGLQQEGIPTFQGSFAADYLSTVFKV